MDINLKIKSDDFPILFKLKKKELDNIIIDIFKKGYDIYFPELNEEYLIENKVSSKINNLENVLTKLIGLSSSSARKGELAENILEEIIKSKYKDINYTDMSNVNHSGDAWLKFDSYDNIVMIESKNYNYKVNKDEVTKMKNDMITNNINWGLFISWNSKVQNYRDFDIEIFNHHEQSYTIIFISELSKDVDRIELCIQLLRKLILNYNKDNKFPWITNKIKNDLEQLNNIITLNYQLTDNFYDLENIIKSGLNKYYTNMRDYQHKIDIMITEISKNINGTISDSLIENSFNYNLYLDNYKNDKKIFSLLCRILDLFKEFNLIINNNDNIICLKNSNNIGNIKIQKKKIIIYINKYNTSCEFNIDNSNDEGFSFLKLIFKK
jgi:hypothetical protein